MTTRHRILPTQGRLLVSTDLHGNREDFDRLANFFAQARAKHPETYWAVLGDTVHGPNPAARAQHPALYDYPDESFSIVEELDRLSQQHPEHLLYVLGNHDYAHLGGPRTGKFYPDETEFLESSLQPAQREQLRAFFARSLLAVAAPCGLLLAHGSPDDCIRRLAELDEIEFPASSLQERRILRGFLCSYGQPREVTETLLRRLSTEELALHLVVHGHDRDEAGYFTEGDNQICPVLFGAPRENKRVLWLDLSARYQSPADLREGHEILRLHHERSPDTLAL